MCDVCQQITRFQHSSVTWVSWRLKLVATWLPAQELGCTLGRYQVFHNSVISCRLGWRAMSWPQTRSLSRPGLSLLPPLHPHGYATGTSAAFGLRCRALLQPCHRSLRLPSQRAELWRRIFYEFYNQNLSNQTYAPWSNKNPCHQAYKNLSHQANKNLSHQAYKDLSHQAYKNLSDQAYKNLSHQAYKNLSH